MATDKLKKIIDILSEDDAKGISKQEIQAWENLHSLLMTTDPKYRRDFISGKIKANIKIEFEKEVLGDRKSVV